MLIRRHVFDGFVKIIDKFSQYFVRQCRCDALADAAGLFFVTVQCDRAAAAKKSS